MSTPYVHSPALRLEVKQESIAQATEQMESCLIAGLLAGTTTAFRHIRDARRLTEGDIYDERLQTIWRAMDELETTGQEIDKATVRAHILASGLLERAGGEKYLYQLETAGDADLNYLVTYARQVREYAQRRRLDNAANLIKDMARKPTIPVADVYSLVLRTLDNATPASARAFTDAPTAYSQAFDRYAEAAKARAAGRPLVGLISGIDAFDKLSEYQFDYGTLMVIFGSTGLGKSTLACNLMSGYAARDIPVLFATLEMPVDRVIDRTLAGVVQVPEKVLRNGEANEEQWQKLVGVMSGETGFPWSVTGACQTTDDMYEQMVAMSEIYGGRRGILIIDTLNSMKEAGDSDNPYVQITNAIKAVDRIKLRTGWAIIGLAQQRIDIDNKVSMDKQRTMLRPNIGNIQNSRELVQKAEFLVGMYSPEYWARQIPGYSDQDACPDGYTRLDMMKSRYSNSDQYTRLRFLSGIPSFRDTTATHVDLNDGAPLEVGGSHAAWAAGDKAK